MKIIEVEELKYSTVVIEYQESDEHDPFTHRYTRLQDRDGYINWDWDSQLGIDDKAQSQLEEEYQNYLKGLKNET